MTEEDTTTIRTRLSSRRAMAVLLVVAFVALAGVAGTAAVALPSTPTAGTDAADVSAPAAQQNGSMQNGSQQMAYARVGHFSADAPAVDVSVDGEEVFAGVEYGDITAYEALPAGEHLITIAAADNESAVVFNNTVSVQANQAYTVGATGLLEPGNEEYDFVSSNGSDDAPYTSGGEAVVDDASVTLGDEENVTEASASNGSGPSVTFAEQTTEGNTVTVSSVTVPEGGFVAIHNASLLDGDALGSVIGVSEYLEPGTTEDVEIELFTGVNGAEFSQDELQNESTLIAMPHQDAPGSDVSFAPLVLQDQTQPPTEAAAVRLAHAVPGVGPVDVTVGEGNNTTVLFDNATFRNATQYVQVPGGEYTLDVRPATANNSGDVVASFDAEVENGTSYTAYAYGDGDVDGIDLNPETDGDVTSVRVAHLSPDAPAVDVYVDNETFLSNVSSGTVTGYDQTTPSEHTVTITEADNRSAVLFNQTLPLMATDYTIAAVGQASPGAMTQFTPLVIQDNGTVPDENTSAVQLVHAAPGVNTVDVTVEQNNSTTVLYDNVSFSNVSQYVQVPAGEYDLQVRAATSGNNGEIIDTFGVDVAGDETYTVFATGETVDELELVVEEDD